MLAPAPNLRQVYLDTADERRWLAQAAKGGNENGGYFAEIVPGASACWYVLVARPRAEESAVEWLAKRRVGVYLPFEDRRAPRGTSRHLLLPGYVLVFLWGLRAHLALLELCPGIHDLLRVDGRAVVVPWRVINDIQKLELRLWARAHQPYRPRRGQQWEKTVCESPYSALAQAGELDANGRISAFHQALGLAS